MLVEVQNNWEEIITSPTELYEKYEETQKEFDKFLDDYGKLKDKFDGNKMLKISKPFRSLD